MVIGFAVLHSALPVLMNDIIEEFHLFGVGEGMMSSMINLGGIIALITTPLLQGRIKKTLVLLLSGTLQVLMTALTGGSPFFSVLLFACVVLGMGFSWFDTYANSNIVDVNQGRSSKYLGALHGCFGIGALLTPLLIQSLLPGLGWRNVYFVIAGLMLAAVMQFLLTTKSSKKELTNTVTEEQKLKMSEVIAYIKEKRNVLLLLAGVFYSATQAGLMTWLVRYMTVRFDAELLGATAFSIYWIFSTLSRFLAPRIKTPPIRLHIYGVLLSGIFQAAGVLSGSAVVMCIATGAIGMVSGQCMPMLVTKVLPVTRAVRSFRPR
jgi:fucose permease